MEYFLEFLTVDETNRKFLFDAITNGLNTLSLYISNLREQGYHDGSDIIGKHQGVQKKIFRHQSWIILYHVAIV